jgi:hypothetical protein
MAQLSEPESEARMDKVLDPNATHDNESNPFIDFMVYTKDGADSGAIVRDLMDLASVSIVMFDFDFIMASACKDTLEYLFKTKIEKQKKVMNNINTGKQTYDVWVAVMPMIVPDVLNDRVREVELCAPLFLTD